MPELAEVTTAFETAVFAVAAETSGTVAHMVMVDVIATVRAKDIAFLLKLFFSFIS